MTSDKKIEANRRNALKSTGPKTPEGKAAVRFNALKHGLLSQEILLPGEDAEALRELDEGLRAELQPAGVVENLLVNRITLLFWKLQRAARVEAGIFARELYEERGERAEREANAQLYKMLEDIVIAHLSPTDKRLYGEAMEKVEKMRAKQNEDIATLGSTFARDAEGANAFSKLSRCETTIERGLYKALHELERRQAARLGGNVPAPLAVDVDVSGIPEGES
jgi:hypothetical protein